MTLKERPGSSRVYRREGKHKCPRSTSRKANLSTARSSALREAAPRPVSWRRSARESAMSPSVKRRKKSEAARKNRNKALLLISSEKDLPQMWRVFFFQRGALIFPRERGRGRRARGGKGGYSLSKRIPPLKSQRRGSPLDPQHCGFAAKSCTRCAIGCGVHGFAMNPCVS